MRRADSLIVFLCVVLGGALGSWYVGTARRSSSVTVTSAFNHRVFGAALMSACGRGLTTPVVPIEVAGAPENQTALIDFLAMRRQAIACRDIPADVPVDGLDSLQRASIYLIRLASGTWTIAGTTWLGIDLLLGVLYGVSIALAYLLCRVAMGRVTAAIVAALFMISPLHLTNLPDLRDYAKVPFFLASLLIVGLLATRRRTAAAVVGLSAVAGALVGLGFGVRTDVAINLIVVLVAIVGFLPQPLSETWKSRLVAAAACVACFTVVAYPVIKTYQSGIPIWHVALLGYAHDWDETLDVAPAPYESGYFYSDSYVATQVDAFWSRITGSAAQVSVGLPFYPEASRDYYFRLLKTFPADALLRGWAALIKVVDLPFSGMQAVPVFELPGWLARVMVTTQRVLGWGAGCGVPLFALVVLAMSAVSIRLATLTFGVVAFFGAYPSIQFQPRHIVHLEVLSLWMLGLAASSLWGLMPGARRAGDPAGARYTDSRRLVLTPLLFGLGVLVLVFVPLLALRAFQQRSASALLSTYGEGRIEPVSLTSAPVGDGRVRVASGPETLPRPRGRRSMYSEMLVADVSAVGCPAERPVLTFSYQSQDPAVDFTRRYAVAVPADGQIVKVYFPIYETGASSPDPALLAFGGLDVDETELPCVKRIGRFVEPDAFPLLLPAVLPANWRDLPLHQTLRGWETPALSDPARHLSYFAPAALHAAQSRLVTLSTTTGRKIDGGVEYRAPIARLDRQGAVIVDGVAGNQSAYLVAWGALALASHSVIVAEGSLERGGFTVGLTDASGWVEKIDVQTPGPFRAFVQAPRDGRYQVVVANNVKGAALRSRFTIARIVIVEGVRE